MVVSLGTGIYPAELVGDTRAEGLLYFGSHWLNIGTLMKNVKSLMTLLTNAVSCNIQSLHNFWEYCNYCYCC